jgi:putative DNA primase/helicase
VIGDLATAKQVHIFESPWDMLALADRTDLYLNEHHAFVATRGAGNAALVKRLIPEGVSVLAWPQNDKAGEKWLTDLITYLPVAKAVVPAQFKDVNEWTKAGASAEDLYLAMFKNELAEKPEIPEPVSDEGTDADEETLQRLAALPPLEYERVRKAEAEKLGCRRVSILDRLVNAKRLLSQSASDLQGRTVNLPDVEPWPKPVNGAEVLNAVAETYSRYVALPAGAAHTLALWCAHVYCFFIFLCSPRLNVTSPEKSCGKTTLRDVTGTLVPKPLFTENLTVAVLFRVIDKHKPTLLADECDAWINDNEELRGLLNAGHRRGGQALRCEGDNNEVRAFAVFGPAVVCGIGSLPGTLHDRSIVIRLERAKPGEVRQRFDPRHVEHEMELCRKLARFVADNMTALELSDPKLPDCAFNRLADNWRPLFAIAEIAGGDWPKHAADAFTKLTRSADVDAQGIGTMLLADIRDIFDRIEDDPVSVADLVDALVEMEDRPWPEFSHGKPITKVKFSRMLKRFGIVSTVKRKGETTFRGYDRAKFNDAFARYTPL